MDEEEEEEEEDTEEEEKVDEGADELIISPVAPGLK